MFDASTLPAVVRLLNRREASLWHACQLNEFDAYLRLNGIASRATLERNNLRFTEMVSDAIDRRNGYWDRLYFSLEDIGHGFARGWTMHPNVFGPIALQVAPNALLELDEAAFCPRAATAPGFDLEAEALSDAALVDALFLHDAGAGFPWSADARFGDRLREALGSPTAKNVEIVGMPKRPVLDLRHVVAVWVDPIAAEDRQLIDVVEGLAEQSKVPLRVRRRTLIQPSRFEVWQDIARLALEGETHLIRVMNRADASPAFRDWARSINAADLAWVWERFARYLHDGTMSYLKADPSDSQPAMAKQTMPAMVAERPSPGATLVGGAATGTPRSVRVCGHLIQAWDNGTCYACVGAQRSSWRYDQ